MIDALVTADTEAAARYQETAELSRRRLADVQQQGADVDERVGRAAWLCCMLLSTSEEAVRAKEALMRARDQYAQDQLHGMRRGLQEEEEAREKGTSERECLRVQLQEVNGKMKRHTLESKQQQRRESSRVQALQEQIERMEQTRRLFEVSLKEERRSEQASAAQREKNFQSAIVRMQKALDISKVEGSEREANLALRSREAGAGAAEVDALRRQLNDERAVAAAAAAAAARRAKAAVAAAAPGLAAEAAEAAEAAAGSKLDAERARAAEASAMEELRDAEQRAVAEVSAAREHAQAEVAQRTAAEEERGKADVERAEAAAAAAAARTQCRQLEAQCSRGIQLIGLLKQRLKDQQDQPSPAHSSHAHPLQPPTPSASALQHHTPDTRVELEARPPNASSLLERLQTQLVTARSQQQLQDELSAAHQALEAAEGAAAQQAVASQRQLAEVQQQLATQRAQAPHLLEEVDSAKARTASMAKEALGMRAEMAGLQMQATAARKEAAAAGERAAVAEAQRASLQQRIGHAEEAARAAAHGMIAAASQAREASNALAARRETDGESEARLRAAYGETSGAVAVLRGGLKASELKQQALRVELDATVRQLAESQRQLQELRHMPPGIAAASLLFADVSDNTPSEDMLTTSSSSIEISDKLDKAGHHRGTPSVNGGRSTSAAATPSNLVATQLPSRTAGHSDTGAHSAHSSRQSATRPRSSLLEALREERIKLEHERAHTCARSNEVQGAHV